MHAVFGFMHCAIQQYHDAAPFPIGATRRLRQGVICSRKGSPRVMASHVQSPLLFDISSDLSATMVRLEFAVCTTRKEKSSSPTNSLTILPVGSVHGLLFGLVNRTYCSSTSSSWIMHLLATWNTPNTANSFSSICLIDNISGSKASSFLDRL